MLPVTKIQHFCTKDGPGIRTTVFLKGCPLRCIWCHNPETQSMADQFFYAEHLCIRCGICEAACPSRVHHITDSGHCLERSKCTGCMKCADACPTGALERCSKHLSAEEIFRSVMKDAAFYNGIGGVTFSGGEPFCQAEAFAELGRLAHENGYNVVTYTGYTYEKLLEGADKHPEWMDLLKQTDYLIDGRFILEEKSLMLKFRGSRNQRIIDVKKSLESNQIVENYDI